MYMHIEIDIYVYVASHCYRGRYNKEDIYTY